MPEGYTSRNDVQEQAEAMEKRKPYATESRREDVGNDSKKANGMLKPGRPEPTRPSSDEATLA